MNVFEGHTMRPKAALPDRGNTLVIMIASCEQDTERATWLLRAQTSGTGKRNSYDGGLKIKVSEL
jgi:hypothetical protein